MCEKHREKLSEDPKNAVMMWSKLINLARHQAAHGQWHKCINSYGNAFDAAEIIFESDVPSTAVNRYIRTACEFAYAIRQCNYPCDLSLFAALIKRKLEKNLYPASILFLIRPLKDIISAPMDEVDRWMEALIEADYSKQNRQLH